MAPREYPGNYAVSRGVARPDKFKCYTDGKLEPASNFSNKQLKRWDERNRRNNDGVNPASIGLVCKKHTGQPVAELKCMGPCGEAKGRNHFSHSQRRNKLRWCAVCVRWKEQQNHENPTTAFPNGQASQDEIWKWICGSSPGFQQDPEYADDDHNDNNDGCETVYGSDEEGEGDMDDEGYDDFDDGSESGEDREALVFQLRFAHPPAASSVDESVASLSIDQGAASETASTADEEYDTKDTWAPPHLRSLIEQSKGKGKATIDSLRSTTPSVSDQMSRSASATSPSIPPHERKEPHHVHAKGQTPSIASSDSRAGIDSWSTVTPRSRQPRVPHQTFSAFDSQGVPHERVAGSRTGTSVSETISYQHPSRAARPPRGNFARPGQRKDFKPAVDFTTINPTDVRTVRDDDEPWEDLEDKF